jgi:hypothetical protein
VGGSHSAFIADSVTVIPAYAGMTELREEGQGGKIISLVISPFFRPYPLL